MSSDKTELRGLCPTDLAQALDALAFAEGMDRNSYVVEVLHRHAKSEGRKTTLRHRMLKGNPYLSEDGVGVVE